MSPGGAAGSATPSSAVPFWVESGAEPDWEVVKAVAALPANNVRGVFLRHWGDLPVDEVASLTGARPGTVKRYLHLAHRSLKGRLS